MSLKQECVDMLNLIIKSLQEDNDYYDFEVDSYRDICQRTGEDITYSDCSGCDNCDIKCRYKKQIKVDVSFWNGGDCQYNFVLGRDSVRYKGIQYIESRKQLIDELAVLKKELEAYKNWCAEFGEKYDEYLNYAKQFAQKIKDKYLIFLPIQVELLPIIFHTDYNYCNGKIDYTTYGNLCIAGKQNVINIFCCMDRIEETKRTIRHEVLHYMLYIAGLKHDDDTAIFHYLCDEYDANAYKKMSNMEQELYIKLVAGINTLKEKTKIYPRLKNNYDSACLSMLLAVGAGENNSTYEALCKNGKELFQLFSETQESDMTGLQ